MSGADFQLPRLDVGRVHANCAKASATLPSGARQQIDDSIQAPVPEHESSPTVVSDERTAPREAQRIEPTTNRRTQSKQAGQPVLKNELQTSAVQCSDHDKALRRRDAFAKLDRRDAGELEGTSRLLLSPTAASRQGGVRGRP
jgi:hypothetical protein